MARHIFISYSKKDSEFCHKLADDLEAVGFKIWIDRALEVGQQWERQIELGLEEAQDIIVILSNNSIASAWVQHEGSIAYGLKKKLFPVLMEEISFDKLPIWMEKTQFHSFVGVSYEQAFEALVEILTPPNLVQDLLDQEVEAYKQTGDLISAAKLEVINEVLDTLEINEEAKRLIGKSQSEVDKQARQRRRLLRGLVVITMFSLVVSIIAFSLSVKAENRRVEAVTAQANALNAEATSEENVQLALKAESTAVANELIAQNALTEILSSALVIQAEANRNTNLPLSYLLNVEALNGSDTYQVLNSALSAIQSGPQAFLHAETDSIWDLTYSPDGRRLAARTGEGTVILWDTLIYDQVGDALRGPAYLIGDLFYSPDLGELTAFSVDGTITSWDTSSYDQIREPVRGNHQYRHAVFSPDGQIIAAVTSENAIILLDRQTLQPIGAPLFLEIDADIYQSPSFFGSINIIFSPDGHTLATSTLGKDIVITLWDVASQQQVGEPMRQAGNPESNAYYANSGIIAGSWATALAFSPDGSIIASGSIDGSILLWDAGIQQQLGSPLLGHTDQINSLAFSSDGRSLVSGSADQTVIIWDLVKQTIVGKPHTGHEAPVSSVTFSPDAKTVASASQDGGVILWRIESEQIINIAEPVANLSGTVHDYLYLPSGEIIAAGYAGNDIILWKDNDPQVIEHYADGLDNLSWVILSPDGSILAEIGYDGRIILWDTETGQQIGEPLQAERQIGNSLAFSPDMKTIVTGDDMGSIRLWDVQTQQQVGEFATDTSAFDGYVTDLVFSKDGQTLFTGHFDANVKMWDVQTQTVINELPFGAYEIVLSQDERYLAASNYAAESAIVWDLLTQQQVGELTHTTDINGQSYPLSFHTFAFSSDNKYLATATNEYSIILWDLESQQPIGERLLEHKDRIRVLSFSADGQFLISMSDSGEIIQWDLPPRSWQQTLCVMANRYLTQTEWEFYLGNDTNTNTCEQLALGGELLVEVSTQPPEADAGAAPTPTPAPLDFSPPNISRTATIEVLLTQASFVQNEGNGFEQVPTLATTPTPADVSATPRDEGEYHFSVMDDSPRYTAHPAGCEGLYLGGEIFDAVGAPYEWVTILLASPDLEEHILPGSNTLYGPSGYEVLIADAPAATNEFYSIQLFDSETFESVSDILYFETFDDCSQNLIIFNFKQD